MKKVLSFLLVASMILSTAAVLAEATDDVHVTVYCLWSADSSNGKFIYGAADEFNAANPGITVELQNQGGYDGVAEKLLASIAANDLPTMAMIEESFLAQFYPIADDMTKYVSQETIDNYIPGLLASSYEDGQFLAVPINRSMPAFFYNKDICVECGLPAEGPQTWDEVYAFSKTIAEKIPGTYGFASNWDSDCWRWESALNSYGGRVLSDDGLTVTFDGPAGYTIVELWQTMIKEGLMPNPYLNDSTNPYPLFVEGKVAMYFDSTGKYSSILRSRESGEMAFDCGMCLVPMGTERAVISGGANMILCKSASEEEKAAAGKFLEYLAGDDYASRFFLGTGYLATTKSCLEYGPTKAAIESDPNYAVMIDQMQYIKRRPWSASWREIYTMFVQDLEAALINPDLDAKEIVAEGAVKAQEIIDKNK